MRSGTISTLADVDLVDQVRTHDEEALIQLYRRYGKLVYSIALQTLENQQDAEEVTQDVFLRVWESSDQYDPSLGRFPAWLTRITRNAAIDRLRKQQRREPTEGTVSLDNSPQLWETIQVADDKDELRRSLAAEIGRLAPEQREAVFLAYFYGMTQREIAHQLKRPLGTVKSHIRQAMQRLRAIWWS